MGVAVTAQTERARKADVAGRVGVGWGERAGVKVRTKVGATETSLQRGGSRGWAPEWR